MIIKNRVRGECSCLPRRSPDAIFPLVYELYGMATNRDKCFLIKPQAITSGASQTAAHRGEHGTLNLGWAEVRMRFGGWGMGDGREMFLSNWQERGWGLGSEKRGRLPHASVALGGTNWCARPSSLSTTLRPADADAAEDKAAATAAFGVANEERESLPQFSNYTQNFMPTKAAHTSCLVALVAWWLGCVWEAGHHVLCNIARLLLRQLLQWQQ